VSWVIKRGRWEYVFAGAVVNGIAHEWTDDQALAHRFDDRNFAAAMVGEMPAAEEARVVRLVPRGKP